MKKSLIEKWLPVSELSRDAAIEMGYKAIPAYIKHCRELKIPEEKIIREFYDPKIRNLHPWFARRPCSVARAITLAAALPDTTDSKSFMKAIGWEAKSDAFVLKGYPPLIFYTDPDREAIEKLLFELLDRRTGEIVVCDPMAGGGTIPFESLRLGFKSIAVEYNPVAYLILKGTVEYPSHYGKNLAERLRDESKRLISSTREALGRFYPPDSEGYIISRGIKCPNCKGQIPLLHEAQIGASAYLDLRFDARGKTFTPSITKHPRQLVYEERKRGEIICPYCRKTITKRTAYEVWTADHVAILRRLKEGFLDKEKILSTHILLVKQIRRGYSICDEGDISRFLEACRTLMNSYNEIEQYIPTAQIPPNNEVFAPLRECGMKYWYELFNPRQLVAIATLVKYLHDRWKDSLSKEELGVAISLYLAFGISRMIDYNSIATTWKQGTIRDTIGRYAQARKITYGEEYCEAIVPYRNLNWIYEPHIINRNKTEGGIYPILSELCKRVEKLGDKANIIHGDSRFLSSILSDVKVDIINVDPPYFDNQIYSDISEYFWQIFSVALNPLIVAGLLFKESNLAGWRPTSSQVPREGEIISRRSEETREKTRSEVAGEPSIPSFDERWYTNQMGVFFGECLKVLKDDGVLLTWFTHRSLEAWKAIISSLYAGGFRVTKLWPITSELLTRLVSKGGDSTLNRTLIIVARKRGEEETSESELKEYAINFMKEMSDALADIGATQSEFRTFLLAASMCAITRIPLHRGVSDPIQYCKSELIPWSVKLADEMFPTLYEQFNKTSPKHTLENFL